MSVALELNLDEFPEPLPCLVYAGQATEPKEET